MDVLYQLSYLGTDEIVLQVLISCNFLSLKRVIIDEGNNIIINVRPRGRRGSVPLQMKTKSLPSDAQVLKSSQSHPWMFGILVDRYQEAFLRKGLYMLHSRDLAEDAVQETFLKIYKHAHKFSNRKGASFRSWAYKILTNTCLSLSSRKVLDRARVQAVDFAELDNSSSTSDYTSKEQVSFVRSVLSRLPSKLSRLLFLYFFEEKSYEEIALIEQVSLSSVRSGLHRAKKQFKNIAIKMV